ncbi:MAG: exosortase/archaeosortase family protein [Bacteroidetes bacterium]|jgi:exosortase/archaeosortase family protein|nr:exosortase/archaeosortase family protein [Bacteroidota bacterium]
MNLLKDRTFMLFSVKFILIFAVAYYGTVAFIGITSPGKIYSAFADHYLNYPNWLRRTLLFGSKKLLAFLGTDTYSTEDFRLRKTGGRGVFLSYSCIGYGVMSFWIAFVIASTGTFMRKLKWWIGGLMIIWLINIGRIAALLLAIQHDSMEPFGIDHHTLFNIVAYIAIFILIYFFEKRSGVFSKATTNEKPVK